MWFLHECLLLVTTETSRSPETADAARPSRFDMSILLALRLSAKTTALAGRGGVTAECGVRRVLRPPPPPFLYKSGMVAALDSSRYRRPLAILTLPDTFYISSFSIRLVRPFGCPTANSLANKVRIEVPYLDCFAPSLFIKRSDQLLRSLYRRR
jgi:hypothetical protein